MNKFKSLVLIVLGLISISLSAQITVSPDRTDATYSIGESMNFIVSGSSGLVSYTIHYDHGVTPAIATGSVQLINGGAEIPFTINEPSVVLCTVTNSQFQTDVAAAAFSPFEIQPYEDDPLDFDIFWQNQKNELSAVPINSSVRPLVPDFDTRTRDYRINLGHIDGRRVYEYLSIPDRPGTFPAVISHAAFGVGPNICVPRPEIAADIGVISLSIWMHNAEPDVQASGAYFPKNWENPDRNYFRYGVLGIIRAIDFIYTLPEFRGEGIGLNGISEGGGMSILAAGIDSRVTAVSASIFAHNEHSGYKYGRASGFPYYLYESSVVNQGVLNESVNQGAKYFDALRSAKRFDGDFLGSVGYVDLISIPATNFGTYNQFKGSTVLIHKVEGGHNNPQEFYLGKFDFFRNHFGLPGEKGYSANAGFDQNLTNNSAFLSGVVAKNGLNNFSLPVKWEVVKGPGIVTFSNQNERNTAATFSENGEYILRFSATDKSLLASNKTFYTIADQVTVSINNDQIVDIDGDGFAEDIDCNDVNPNIGGVGSACNDGNINTTNDILQPDCSCSGTPIQPPPPVDIDGDGYSEEVDCDDTNPNIGGVGTSCNDGNANTTNDILQADCTCSGTPIQPPPPTDCNVTFSVDGLNLTVEPLNDLINFVRVYDLGYNLIMSCEEWSAACNQTQEFILPGAGDYFVQILTYSDWSTEVCNIFHEIIATDTPGSCQNVTNGGIIQGDESLCPTDSPTPITSEASPSGGTGAVEYLWLSSDRRCPGILSDSIPGANQSTFELGQLSKTTYFRRLSRTVGCDDWFEGESNCVVKTLKPDCNVVPQDSSSCKATHSLTNDNRLIIEGIDENIATVKVVEQLTGGVIYSCNNFTNVCAPSITINMTPGKYFVQIITGESWGQDYLCNIFDPLEVRYIANLRLDTSNDKFLENNRSNFTKSNKTILSTITVFPNPATDVIYVSLDEKSRRQAAKVELINRLGKVEKRLSFSPEIELGTVIISTEGLAQGIYFVRVSPEGEKPIVKKVVLAKN